MRTICVQAPPKPQKPCPDPKWEACHSLFQGLRTGAEAEELGLAHVHSDVSTWTTSKHRG